MSGKETVVFKMRYKPRNISSTKVLNLKHLDYIATRAGVRSNPESGFGLWGKLDGMKKAGNIETLQAGRAAVGEASMQHTVYRAVLSVDRETARTYNLYDRAEWEKLLRTRLSVLSREMRIDERDFRFLASMHYKKDHPHVHLLFWTASPEPKTEYIEKKRFEAMSENVRKAFAGAILNRDAIQEKHGQSDELLKESRLRLCAMLTEANLPDALELSHLKRQQCDALGRELLALSAELPTHGALKYAFLPADYKARLDAYIQHVLSISDFAHLYDKYIAVTAEVSKLYGNTPELRETYLKEARETFMTQMGNETLKFLREIAKEMPKPASDLDGLIAAVRMRGTDIIEEKTEYLKLLRLMPGIRTPRWVLEKNEAFHAQLNAAAQALSQDLRIRRQTRAYFRQEKTAGDASAPDNSAIEKKLFTAMRELVWQKVEEDKGYAEQRRANLAEDALLQTFRLLSQQKGQAQAQRELRHTRWSELSETAKKNLRKQREHGQGWEPGM